MNNLAAFAKTNLTYQCLPYTSYNQVPECDCMACANARPDFMNQMCSFREAQDVVPHRRRSETNPENDWHKICNSGASCKMPTQCCDPAKGIQIENGCPTCIPTVDCKMRSSFIPTFVHESFRNSEGFRIRRGVESRLHFLQLYDIHKIDVKRSPQTLLQLRTPSERTPRALSPSDTLPRNRKSVGGKSMTITWTPFSRRSSQ